ncbi:MAG: 6-phosphogluconate dehydrogenase [Deltaproteobacteria bacterium]|nr:6-phosphogluconate dehydrogenase [Deltaproteobacteria bacterium]
MRVGFVGLGSQGAAMAQRIERAGFELLLWARRAETLRPFRDSGARPFASLEELAARSDVVGVCVGNDDDVESVVLAERGGLLAGMRPGSVVMVHSTIHPETCRLLGAQAQARRVQLLDAPVSGGSDRALQGELTVMVGGEHSVYERCLPVFESYGSTVKYLGGLGTGQMCKILNNVLFSATLELAHQTVLRARALELDEQAMREVLMASSAQSTALSVVSLLDAPGSERALGNLVKDHALFSALARSREIEPGQLERVAGKATKRIAEALEQESRSGPGS